MQEQVMLFLCTEILTVNISSTKGVSFSSERNMHSTFQYTM